MHAQFARTFAMGAAGLALVSSCAAIRSAAGEIPRPAATATVDTAPAHASLPTKAASYLGAYEADNPRSWSGMKTFARTAGRAPNLALYYSGWRVGFQSSFAKAAWSNGAVVAVDMDPSTVSVKSIANGQWDTYLTNFATAVRSFRHPVVINFGHEMNGQWYSWGYKHTSPKVFISAWRHIVTLFRKVGADNVTWMWTVNWITRDEGAIRRWWPGSSYVTWAAIDGYYYEPSDTFTTKFGPTIAAIRKLSKKVPILVGETAIGPVAGQVAKMPDLFSGVKQYGLLGFVWYDESSVTTPSSIYKQDWRLETSHSGAAAFRRAERHFLAKRLSH
jgi:Glycosyl hydrolase family 26